MMKRPTLLVSAGLLAAALSTAVLAQGSPQPLTTQRSDVVHLGTGFRASKIKGAPVYNRDKDRLGTVDDVIVASGNQGGAYAILSIGGFMGMGKHLIAVSFDQIQVEKDGVILPDATRKSLQALPEFKYASD